MELWQYVLVCVIIGIIAAFIVTGILKAQLKSVHKQRNAGNYVIDGSFKLTNRMDVFLYRNVVRRERPKNNN